MSKRIWISWNNQRRNVGLALAVNASLYMSDYNLPGCLRLLVEFINSWKIIHRERPSICFTMNPSVFSSWWLSILSWLYNFYLVTDLHTPNIKISGLKRFIFCLFFNSGIKRSDAVIVTNNLYRESILHLNPNVIIIPDSIPALKIPHTDSEIESNKLGGKVQILFICSFDPDEPLNEVLTIDLRINDFEILITGNWKKRYKSLPKKRNIRFLGFISNEEFDHLLLSVDGIMTLTSEEGCLCCGAYEAFSAGKPLILSKTKALQEFFGKAPIYTDNTSSSILKSLIELKSEMRQRTEMVIQERSSLQKKFNSSVESLEKIIENRN